ncbi:SLC13 family permease [Desulfovibrio piger]|uniref:SLC13 family permease n=1 Tax=Desulfovibrio piger TaxID=901 RepID=UPI0026E9E8E5|nr:SLC13 family permease [Desulfovibrio piger]
MNQEQHLNRAYWIKWGIALLIPVVTYFWTGTTDLSPEAQRFLTFTFCALAIWTLNILPEPFVAMILPIIYIVTGVGKPSQILSAWSGSAGWLVLSGLFIAEVMSSTGIAKRIAVWSIKLTGGSFHFLLWGFMLAGYIMAPFIPTVTGKAAIFAILAVGICKGFNIQPCSKEAATLVIGALLAVAIPKLAFLSAGVDVAMAMGLYAQATGTPISWSAYFLHNFPPSLLYAALSIYTLLFIMRPKLSFDLETFIREEYETLGPMSLREKKALILLGLLLLSLVTDQIHKIDAGWMMLMIASLAFFPGFSLLDKKSLSNIPYQQVFFVVGCMTIGGAAKASGVDKVIADLLMPLLSGGELYTSFSTFVSGIILNFLFTPIAAFSAMTAPLVEMASQMNMSPLALVYSFSYGLDQYLFPYEFVVTLYFYSTGYIKLSHFMTIFAVRMVLAGAFLALVLYPYWQFVGVF